MKHTKVILGPRYDYWPRYDDGRDIPVEDLIRKGINEMTRKFGKRPEIFYVGQEMATRLGRSLAKAYAIAPSWIKVSLKRPKNEIMELFGCSIRQSRREGIRAVLKDDGFGKIVFDRIDNLK